MNNNYNFNPNPSFMRSIPGAMSAIPMQASRMMPASASGLPRISSLFGGARLGGAAAANAGRVAGAGASKITFAGVLNGASKTLGVINQAIPVFNQVKPIWNNARTMFRVVKEINTKDTPLKNNTINKANNNNTVKEDNNNIIEEKKEPGDNAPTFFA